MGSQKSKRRRTSSSILLENDIQDDINPMSCETCRQKKCKCDRKLPHCSQCSSDPSKCVYPESGKRGLPLGYLNQLEQRLSETESALYGALLILRSMRQAPVVQPPTKADEQKPKAARMDEWSKLPLRNWSDMEQWMTSMSDQFKSSHFLAGVPVATPMRSNEIPDGEAEDTPTPYTWPSRNEISMRNPYENHPYPEIIKSSPGYAHDAVASRTAGVAPSLSGVPDDTPAIVAGNEPARAKAAELSRNKSNIYF